MIVRVALFETVLLTCFCFTTALAGTVPYETTQGNVISHLLETQICDEMPNLPSCSLLNDLPFDGSQRREVFTDNQLLTLVLDYIANTQRINKDLRQRETEHIASIAKLEQENERLEDQVHSLEEEWITTVDRRQGTVERTEASEEQSSSSRYSDSYQPTANVLRPVDCSDYLLLGADRSGVYDIYPYRCRCSGPVKVWCDMETDGGGWTVILNRQNSTDAVNFTQPWASYRDGFGNASNEYWIGNDNLHVMTNTRLYNLRMDFEERDGNFRWAEWADISVANEANRYKLRVGMFNSRSMTNNCMSGHESKYFSTFDYDNDVSSSNCALSWKGGWWYNNCASIDPTRPFSPDGTLNSACTYSLNKKNIVLQGPSMQLKVRPQICNEMVKAVQFNSHTCQDHNMH